MTTEEPRVVDSGRYGMSDAAKILGVARCTLRRWIYAGRVNVGFRNLNGRMFVTHIITLAHYQNDRRRSPPL